MQGLSPVLVAVLFAALAKGEIIDRIAVQVGDAVITMSDIRREIRLTAFQEEQSAGFGPKERRAAAERLVDQRLIRREMEQSRYPEPPREAVDELVQRTVTERFGGDASRCRAALAGYDLTPADLRSRLEWQLSVTRFVSFRFRAGARVTAEDVEEYFRDNILPKLKDPIANPAEQLEADRTEIETLLLEQRADEQLDQWLKQVRQRTVVRFLDSAFDGKEAGS